MTANNHLCPQPVTAAVTIQAWLVTYLANELALEPHEIDVHMPFDRLGLDSVTAMVLTGELEQWLGRHLDPELVLAHGTVARISSFLEG